MNACLVGKHGYNVYSDAQQINNNSQLKDVADPTVFAHLPPGQLSANG